jgi:hypothetical protein
LLRPANLAPTLPIRPANLDPKDLAPTFGAQEIKPVDLTTVDKAVTGAAADIVPTKDVSNSNDKNCLFMINLHEYNNLTHFHACFTHRCKQL